MAQPIRTEARLPQRGALRRCIASMLAWIAVAGCEGLTPTAVSTPALPLADAVSISAAEHDVEQAFDTPALQSLAALAPILTIPGGVASRTVALSHLGSTCGAGLVSDGAGALAVAAGIPDSILGRVLVYDSVAQGYGVGADTGGPSDGVRFLLYTPGLFGRPAFPLAVDGWLDLRDQTAGTSTLLAVQVVNGTEPNADYTIVPWGGQGVDSGFVTGAVTQGKHLFTFADSIAQQGSQTVTAATITGQGQDLQLRLAATRNAIDPYDSFYDLDYTFTRKAETIRIVGSITTYCLLPAITTTVSVNGVAFAQIGMTTGSVDVVRVDSQPLTSDQQQAILDLLYGEERLFASLTGLFAPARQFVAP
ncbi:MAG TPA: hypothetical protein VMH88_14025 [Gemmatimonadales bacterium]|nr:hypothetical protein [Gemmatimonadales bacterium]